MNPPEVQGCCGLCGAPVYWAKHVNGSIMPVNPEVAEGGNIILCLRKGVIMYHVLTLDEKKKPLKEGEKRRFSHFRSCPNYKKAKVKP